MRLMVLLRRKVNGHPKRGKKFILPIMLLVVCSFITIFAGRLLFMTTNKIEDLDEALIRYFFFGYSKEMSCLMNQFYRDGRIDKQIHLGYATKEQIAGLFAHFYSLDICATIVKEFTEQLTTYGVSMA